MAKFSVEEGKVVPEKIEGRFIERGKLYRIHSATSYNEGTAFGCSLAEVLLMAPKGYMSLMLTKDVPSGYRFEAFPPGSKLIIEQE
jgi:hypothetical protein